MKRNIKHLRCLEEMLDARKSILVANDHLFEALELAKGDKVTQDLVYDVIRMNQLLIEKLCNRFEEIEATATEK